MMFVLKDEMHDWWVELFANHKEEARKRAASLIDAGQELETGCIVTGTVGRRKVRFLGRQLASYRFIYYVMKEDVPEDGEVVRHMCNVKSCINPDHLTVGTRADNKDDDRAFAAYGVDPKLL